jgi:hypothetical protein
MKIFACILVVAAAGLTVGCADKNTALFVTNSSLGINFDSKPPTANIAYDRTEGFIGPRFPNGGAPPAVASIETGGTIFDPKVRQVYATGDAAVKATKGASAGDGPQTLEGEPNQKQLMFFGTETTIGLKVGFGTTGTPDSLLFGYRRKEASVIPLGETQKEETTPDGQKVKKTVAVYPSVLASIDMNVDAKHQAATGLSTKQFFATGQAAVALATNDTVAAAFRARAIESAKSGLTDEQVAAAKAAGVTSANVTRDRLNKISDYISNADGTLNKAKRDQMVTDANAQNPEVVPDNLARQLKNYQNVGAMRDRVSGSELTVKALFDAMRPAG